MDPTTAPTPTPRSPTSQAEFQGIVKRANSGDREALAHLRRTLDENPNIWADVSRIAIESERKLIDQIAAGDRLVEESIKRKLKQMRADISGASPVPAETMAVDRVIVAWLLLHAAEKSLIADCGSGLPQAQFNVKKHDVANRQYLAAVKSLRELQERLPKGRPSQSNKKPSLRIFDGESEQTSEMRATGTCSDS